MSGTTSHRASHAVICTRPGEPRLIVYTGNLYWLYRIYFSQGAVYFLCNNELSRCRAQPFPFECAFSIMTTFHTTTAADQDMVTEGWQKTYNTTITTPLLVLRPPRRPVHSGSCVKGFHDILSYCCSVHILEFVRIIVRALCTDNYCKYSSSTGLRQKC